MGFDCSSYMDRSSQGIYDGGWNQGKMLVYLVIIEEATETIVLLDYLYRKGQIATICV